MEVEAAAQPLQAPYPLCLYEWTRQQGLSIDESYSDLALAVSRNSRCDGGHMGCVIVGMDEHPVVLAINSTLYEPEGCKSDVHAEANAICAAARHGVALQGCSIYITMPPCRACFGLLQAAGIKRCVFRRSNLCSEMDLAAEREGMELVGRNEHDILDASTDRVRALWDAYAERYPDVAEKEGIEAKALQKQVKEVKRRRAIERRKDLESGKCSGKHAPRGKRTAQGKQTNELGGEQEHEQGGEQGESLQQEGEGQVQEV
mmetsp:Transcript_17529/g.30083  ORF Transcript_17529/g.30083 Transcript_17529/m.30083 type:complete len:260 (+) Transcript_17529:149-928(+)|eukprot:CAMPEP_0119106020 /NCGR_PEP_ID=MMETSP1180-20130426/3829_1 /TAXON_ID=3052 ORGANISM="Chlamydomonas cf sp, Strain CCMP681" /NCGR_SAMPLE_ID=MMETSP1180 /ASSEMBLY_ACC=CAM_ASM_000741 /LENGTH=259 /DNA_ID=CAMNT_0007091237 /DNA_START=131 /DNA_END=910 /DNA_ORIENTATION=-